MPRSYLRLIPDVYARKVLGLKPGATPYTPAQFTAFIGMLCAAEAVTPRGRFPSKAVLKAMLTGDAATTEVADEVEFLIEQGDLVRLDDGSYYIDGWNELQEGRDPTVNERMRKYRSRERVTEALRVTVPLSAVSSEHRAVSSSQTNEGEENGTSSSPRARAGGRTRGGGPEHVGEVVRSLRSHSGAG